MEFYGIHSTCMLYAMVAIVLEFSFMKSIANSDRKSSFPVKSSFLNPLVFLKKGYLCIVHERQYRNDSFLTLFEKL